MSASRTMLACLGCVAVLWAAAASGAGGSGWTWSKAHRDPLEFRPRSVESEEDPPPPPPPPRDAGDLARLAERRLGERAFAEAEALAEEGLAFLQRSASPEEAEGRALEQKLRRIVQSARKLRARAEAEEEFCRLGIDVAGIIWESSKSVALVDGEVCRAGDIIKGARIEEIHPGEVVFVFKGVRVRRVLVQTGAVRGPTGPGANE